MIDSTDLANFLYAIEKSKIRAGNNIVIRWLRSSYNIKKKLKMSFHGIKYKIGQFEKGTRKETSFDNRFTIFKEYIEILASVTSLAMYPFPEAEKELEYALKQSEMIINIDNFTTIIKLIRVIQNLHRPSKSIERKSSYEFLH